MTLLITDAQFTTLRCTTGAVGVTDVVNKNDLDTAIAGIASDAVVETATTGNLVATRAADVLTKTGPGLITAEVNIDSAATLILNDRVLVKDQTTVVDNGIYYVSDVGTGATPWVLTRAADLPSAVDAGGRQVFVNLGTVVGGTEWRCAVAPAVVNTDDLLFERSLSTIDVCRPIDMELTDGAVDTTTFTGGAIPARTARLTGGLNGTAVGFLSLRNGANWVSGGAFTARKLHFVVKVIPDNANVSWSMDAYFFKDGDLRTAAVHSEVNLITVVSPAMTANLLYVVTDDYSMNAAATLCDEILFVITKDAGANDLHLLSVEISA